METARHLLETRSANLLAFAALLVVGGTATAGGVPMPVDPGELYLEAHLGYGTFDSESSRMLRVYADDRTDPSDPDETITVADSRGFLASFDTSDDEWSIIPGLTFGYATKKPWFKGALGRVTRLEFSGDYYKRDADAVVRTVLIPASGYPTDIGGSVEDRGGGLFMGPIDGAAFDADGNGIDGILLLGAGLGSVGVDPVGDAFEIDAMTLSVEETTGKGQMMVFFDEPRGSWVLTRGVGLQVGYTKSSYDYAIPFGELSNLTEVFWAPGTNTAFHTYDFDLDSYFVGANAAFSIGYRPIKYFTVFLNGSFSPMVAVSRIRGTQYGFCLVENVCNVDTITDGGYDTVELDDRDVNFAYDARSAAGVSLLLYRFVRVTGQVGIFASNQSARPQEAGDANRFEAKLGRMWGYYGRASLMLSF